MAERTREKRLADTDGAEEDDVLALLEEGEVQQIAHAVAVEAHGRVPIEVLEGLRLVESGAVETVAEVLALASVDLILEGEFEEVERGEASLVRIGTSVRQQRGDAGELEPLQHGFERGFHFGHVASPFEVWCAKL